jgi:antitoxin YefM
MELMELVRNAEGGDVDFLRESVGVLAQALMEAEVSEQIGAEHGQRNPEGGTAQRNRYRDGDGDGGHGCDVAATQRRPFVYAVSYVLRMSKTVPVREFRTHLAELLDEVADRRAHVTVTRHGRPAAVLVPVDEYEALEETAAVLSDEDTLAAIRRGLDDLVDGDVVSLQQVRDEHAARRR